MLHLIPAGEDFVGINSETIVVTPENLGELLQVNITLLDDDILELMLEMFTVCLETADPGVTLTTNTTTVLIVEDDGMFVCYSSVFSICMFSMHESHHLWDVLGYIFC